LADLAEGDVFAIFVAIENRLVERVPALKHESIGMLRKFRAAHQGDVELPIRAQPMVFANDDNWVMIEQRNHRGDGGLRSGLGQGGEGYGEHYYKYEDANPGIHRPDYHRKSKAKSTTEAWGHRGILDPFLARFGFLCVSVVNRVFALSFTIAANANWVRDCRNPRPSKAGAVDYASRKG